jgi:glycosyltransferase involved in cell wall biosynthesis
MAPIPAYCLDWHISQSRAFYELLVEPLKPFVDIALTAWNGKDDTPLKHLEGTAYQHPVIFCQRPPTPEVWNNPHAKLVWIPMWDNVAVSWASDDWWASLPKNLRVVAFSEKVAQKAQKAKLPTLTLRYHKNPAEFDQVAWQNGRVLFYWNRTGLFGPKFMEKLCASFDVRELYFRGEVDPKIKGAAYALPSKLGSTIVHDVSRFASQAEYFETLKRCNLYLAPRALEGVGLTFLEAMASGCAVMAYDASTMNEYITHAVDGLLFTNTTLEVEKLSALEKISELFQTRLKKKKRDPHPERASIAQDWESLKRIDLEKIGQAAREKQETGYIAWKNQISDYADFVLNW